MTLLLLFRPRGGQPQVGLVRIRDVAMAGTRLRAVAIEPVSGLSSVEMAGSRLTNVELIG
jgi:hypothetical protein